MIGSARISENGTINGKAGDSTKNEVGRQNWYLHKLSWVCIRPKDKTIANKIADCMERLCDNNHFGYGQSDRDKCLPLLEKVGYDPAKVTIDCNIDCSLSILVCCRYAGLNIAYDNKSNLFYTGNIKDRLKATGQFDILTDDKYCKSEKYLERGDILCTKTKGHVVVYLGNDSKTSEPQHYIKGQKVKVKAIQHEGMRMACKNTEVTITSTVVVRDKPNYDIRDSWIETDDGYASAYCCEGIITYGNLGSWILHDGYKWLEGAIDHFNGKDYIINLDGYIETKPTFNADGSIKYQKAKT